MRIWPLIGLLVLVAIGCDQKAADQPSDTKPDNTEINERDSNSAMKTPIDQNQNQADIDITAAIRSRIVDTEMSVNAQNVKVITQDGHVTLRGPVDSAEEKKKIEEIAHDVAGSEHVDSQLEVK